MKREDLEDFFNKRPSINKTSFCQEAKISKATLDLILKQGKQITDKTKTGLLPVLKRYGYGRK
jgi:hypothetical protein